MPHTSPLQLHYRTDTPDEMFQHLAEALRLLPHHHKIYAHWSHTFHLLIDQQTATCGGHFVGTFAKVDYLLKEHAADNTIRRNINNTRVRLQKYRQTAPHELEQHTYTDFKHLCQFVSLIFSTPVPEEHAALFPKDHTTPRATVLTDCMRGIVTTWDEHFLHLRIDGYADDNPVPVLYNPTDAPQKQKPDTADADNTHFTAPDYSYLSKMLYEGAQVNIIRPRKIGQHLCPEIIILEPDYLVDITTVARCFESYAESPYVNLVRKLQPVASSEAILLGNFAGQLLDEQLHTTSHTRAYSDSVKDFFKTNALNLLTTDVSPTFHNDAQRQQSNISRAINEQLPRIVSRFNREECIVEPSFFSEMLGLQGRMDMLQLDMRVLLEQKAGKGQFPQGAYDIPRHTEQHYVQLLLYMAVLRYNFSDIYQANGHELHAFLLYSKYSESLLGLGFAPELLQRAIRIRNGIAFTELQYANPGQLRLLERLTPEMLNMKSVAGTLWTRYTRPQLARLLAPIHEATPLERDYYFRFLTFVAHEHVLAKLGNRTKEASGFAAKWHCTLDEKLEAGNIYEHMHYDGPETKTAQKTETSPPQPLATPIERIRFAFDPDVNYESSNFRIGDIVAIYPYAPAVEPDIRQAIVFRGSIADITPSHIIVQLRAPQTSTRVFDHWHSHHWAIEHDFLESSYGSMYRSMHTFLSAPKSRRELFLCQRPPAVSHQPLPLLRDYGNFNALAQHVKDARELFLIIGPPGTGKTSFGMLNTLLEALTDPEANVLLLSFTNRAVDEICSKLLETGIDFLRIGRSYNTPEVYRPYLLEQQLLDCTNLQSVRSLIEQKRVVVATTTTLNSQIALLRIKQFALAIIDEASQILEPDLIGIFSAHNDGVPAITKFVMIGDHKQLPAVVGQTSDDSRVDEDSLHSIGLYDCRSSLFERFLSRYGTSPEHTYMLTRQGRMHPDIAAFVNEAFYNGRLGIVPLPHQTAELEQHSLLDEPENVVTPTPEKLKFYENLLNTHRVQFIDTPLPTGEGKESQRLKVNHVEANMIAELVYCIYRRSGQAFHPLSTVGVIVPYRNQITAIRSAIDQYGVPGLRAITIDTVERYQGSQRDYIIYGFTVQRHYQLNFLTDNVFIDTDGTVVDRKLNVALTRAKQGMFLFGHAPLLRQVPIFRHLIDYLQQQGGVV